VPQLQSNFAFTRAYVAETSGQKGGFAGSDFFVDLALFKRPLPPWIEFGPEFEWSHRTLGLHTKFAPVKKINDWRHPEGGPRDIADALQIAQHLAGDADVLTALRSARKRS
jgi:hypothetical protein